MRFRNLAKLALSVAVVAAAAPLASSVQAQQSKPAQQCFRAQDWRGARAAGPREMYLRVGMRDIYRVAFAQDCPGARVPGQVRIENLISGPTNLICATTDLDIWVAPIGSPMSTPCIVDHFTKLTPDEVKALPKKVLP